MNTKRITQVCLLSAGAFLNAQSLPAQVPADGPGTITLKPSSASFLGIGVTEIDSERAKALQLKEVRGVEVTRVEEEGPAGKAGLKPGDIVLEFSGQPVVGTEQFVRLVRETPAGREVKLVVSRGGTLQTLVFKTGSRKAFASMRPLEQMAWDLPNGVQLFKSGRLMPSWRSPLLGIEAEPVEAQLGEYFGVKQGVLVRSVAKNSAAEKSGLRAGDVIIRVDEKPVATPREITSALRTARTENGVEIAVMRERREAVVRVQLEDERARR